MVSRCLGASMTARLFALGSGRPSVLACDAPAVRPEPGSAGDVPVTRHFSLTDGTISVFVTVFVTVLVTHCPLKAQIKKLCFFSI